LIDTARLDKAGSGPEEAAALPPVLARPGEEEGANFLTPTTLSARTVAAAIGVALLPTAAARHNRR
jgi:hypothetical protein